MTGAQGLHLTVRPDGVALLRIDRPEVLNALDQATMTAIVGAVEQIESDPAVRAVVLTGTGTRAFCAGRDLKERAAVDRVGERAGHPMRGLHRNPFEALWECRKPTVAAVNGDAVGAGFELALACDLRVAAAHARFALPEAKRGMGAVFGSTILARSVPSAVYYEWLYLGELMPAADVARWGVLNRVVDADPLAAGLALAREVAGRAPVSLQRFKATLISGREMPVAAALRTDFHPDPYSSEDRIEGVAAFVEKREPIWRGR
ncbi:MAG TPA: enoyl-CoA hydratase-related protein [Nocardioides sp.]|nr:enoyl-CoA hydratase-related protein [Nocardioides sp.]